MRSTRIAVIALSLLLPSAVFAQAEAPLTPPTVDTSSLDASIVAADPFTISINPTYPAPYSQAAISFLSASIDLANATLTLSQNGTQLYKGNVQTVPVSLGRAGSVSSVRATIYSAGMSYSKTVVIQPQDVSIIAEPVASAPVLYPGKPLAPLEGTVRVVAVANLRDAAGKILSPASLSYTWTVDGAQIASASGIGRTSILVASPLQYRSRSVSVVVQNQSGGLAGSAELTFSPSEPTVRIYEQDPLLGIRFEHALSANFSIGDTEKSLYAASFSFPLLRGAPLVRWSLNTALAQIGSSITLRPAGSGQGTAALSVTASASDAASASADISLLFGAKPKVSIFNL